MQHVIKFIVLLLAGINSMESISQTPVYAYKLGFDAASIFTLSGSNELNLEVNLVEGTPILGDIAVGPDGTLYGLSQAGDIREINLETGQTTFVAAYSELAGHTAFTIDAASKAYTLDFFFNLYTIDLNTLEEQFIMNVGELTPGDLAFYRGKLVFISSIEPVIKALDLATLEITTIYCLPEEITFMADVWGLTSQFDECGLEKLFVSNFYNALFLIDVENNSYENLNVTFDVDTDGEIYGIASIDDAHASECNEPVTEADCDGNTGVATVNGDAVFKLYPNPADTQIILEHGYAIRSIELFDMQGALIATPHFSDSSVDVSSILAGAYTMRITFSSGQTRIQRVMII